MFQTTEFLRATVMGNRIGRPTNWPIVIEKEGERLELFNGTLEELGRLEEWLRRRGAHSQHNASVRSLDFFCHERTGGINSRLVIRSEAFISASEPAIILGGIYPSLAPEHAAEMTGVDMSWRAKSKKQMICGRICPSTR